MVTIIFSHVELALMQYPSVTVCIDSTFKTYIDDLLYSNSTLAETENLVKARIWKRNETFYFVNQKFNTKDGYPCMTTSESIDPGRPCAFPFHVNITREEGKEIFGLEKEEHLVNYNCTLKYNPDPWCYTKVDNNGYSLKGKFARIFIYF